MSSKEEEGDELPLSPVDGAPPTEGVADLMERAQRAEEASQEAYNKFRSGIEESKEIFAACQRWWRELMALSDESKPQQ